jgi:acyl-CoA dehydrogenase
MKELSELASIEEVGREVRHAAETVLAPIAEEFGEQSAVCRPLVEKVAELGLFRLMTLDAATAPWLAAHRWSAHAAVREALALVDSQVEEVYTIQGLGMYPLSSMGTPEQQERFLAPAQAGQKLTAFALTEPQAGSDLRALATTATRDGDGWVLNGEKTFISHAPDADTYVVFARHDGEGQGVSAFIVEKGATGFTQEPSLDLLAPHAIGTLHFTDCRVPADQVLGELGRGLRVALKALEYFRPSVGARAVGLARHALDVATDWAKGRIVFGGPLIDQQAIQFSLAEMAVRIQIVRAAVYDAAAHADRGEDIAFRGSAAKVAATEAAQWVVYQAQQICGGRGVISGHPAEKLYRQVRAMTVYEGTSEIQRMIVGRHVAKGTLTDAWGF